MIKTKEYSQALASALIEATSGKEDKIITQMTSLLESRGQKNIIGSVLRGAMHILERNRKAYGAKVVLAREDDGSKYRDHIARDLADLGVTEYTTKLDDSMIGGYLVEGKGKRIDRSVRRKLTDLYTELVN